MESLQTTTDTVIGTFLLWCHQVILSVSPNCSDTDAKYTMTLPIKKDSVIVESLDIHYH